MIQKFHSWLHGQGNDVLTILLIGVAIFCIVTAFVMPAEFKVLALAWIVLP